MISRFLKYICLPTVLGLLVYAGIEIYVNFREDEFGNHPQAGHTDSSRDVPGPAGEVESEVRDSPGRLSDEAAAERPEDFQARIDREFEGLSSKYFQEAGFTAIEAEVLYRSIDESVALGAGSPDADAILHGIRRAFIKLGLPKEREAAAYAAHAKALDETGGFIDFSEWQQCVQKKVAQQAAVDCLIPLATDYVNEISESLDSGRIYLSKFQEYDPIVQKYADKILESCEVEESELANIFYFNLFDC